MTKVIIQYFNLIVINSSLDSEGFQVFFGSWGSDHHRKSSYVSCKITLISLNHLFWCHNKSKAFVSHMKTFCNFSYIYLFFCKAATGPILCLWMAVWTIIGRVTPQHLELKCLIPLLSRVLASEESFRGRGTMTGSIEGLERFDSPGKGRGLRVTRPFKVGELLFSSQAYSYVLSVKERGCYCECCFTR